MKYDLIIFDADGTLRRCLIPGQPCPNKPSEWELLDNVRERLAEFTWGRPQPGVTAYGIASNQAGIAWGFIDYKTAYKLLCGTFEAAFGFVPAINTIQICEHKGECECRKPEPGMLFGIMDTWDVETHRALFVGDMESDKQAARNAGCDFVWAKDFFGWDDGKPEDDT
jgi:HAD superfamily hydrolase (TIGR01662 family)